MLLWCAFFVVHYLKDLMISMTLIYLLSCIDVAVHVFNVADGITLI